MFESSKGVPTGALFWCVKIVQEKTRRAGSGCVLIVVVDLNFDDLFVVAVAVPIEFPQ